MSMGEMPLERIAELLAANEYQDCPTWEAQREPEATEFDVFEFVGTTAYGAEVRIDHFTASVMANHFDALDAPPADAAEGDEELSEAFRKAADIEAEVGLGMTGRMIQTRALVSLIEKHGPFEIQDNFNIVMAGSAWTALASELRALLAAAEAGPRVGPATKRIVEAAVRAMDGFDSVKHRGCGYRFATWLALEDIADALRELGMEAG